MAKQRQFESWHYAAAAALSLLFAYILASRAIDTGSLGQYFLTFVLVGLAIKFGLITFTVRQKVGKKK